MMNSTPHRHFWIAITIGSAGLAAGAASAASTTLHGNAWNTHRKILNATYGGGFSASGSGFSNGSIHATRVNDDADRVFNFASFTASATGRYAAYTQSFGVITDGAYTNLFDVSGYGTSVTGSTDAPVVIKSDFRFARTGNLGGMVTSDPLLNPHHEDGMVTYQISGLSGVTGSVFLVMFEDIRGPRSDHDFDDLAVEVVGHPRSMPLPAAGTAGLVLLGGMILRHRRPCRLGLAHHRHGAEARHRPATVADPAQRGTSTLRAPDSTVSRRGVTPRRSPSP